MFGFRAMQSMDLRSYRRTPIARRTARLPQISDEFRQLFEATLRPMVFNRNVLAYNKAGVFQATLKRLHQMRGSICGRRPKHPDYRDSVLLCAC